jgi:hypothetical protein
VKANRTIAGSLSWKLKVVPTGGRCLCRSLANLLPRRHFEWLSVAPVMSGAEDVTARVVDADDVSPVVSVSVTTAECVSWVGKARTTDGPLAVVPSSKRHA